MKRSTKVAIALEYGQQDSPTVLVKGSEELALEIIEEAKKHGIFIAEDPQLVAALSKVVYLKTSRRSCITRTP